MKVRDICAGIADGSHNPPQGIEISDYLMLSSKNIFDDEITFDDPRYLTQADFEQEDRRTKVKEGDVLLTIVGTVGRTAVVDKKMPRFTLQRSVAVLKPKADICSSRYLMYALQGERTHIENSAKGVAQKGIYLNEVSNIDLRIPALSEQESIVIRLDKIVSIIHFYQQQLQKLDELVKSRFVEMFGEPVTNSHGYEQVTIGNACTLINGRAFKPSEWGEKGLPIVRIQNLNDMNASFNYYAGEVSEQHLIDNGMLLFSWSGTPGTSFGAFMWNRGPGALNQHIFKVIPKLDFDLDYLRYAMNGQLTTIIEKAHGGVGLQHITKAELEKICLLHPEMAEQKRFAAFAKQVDKSKLAVQQSLEKLETLKKSLMQQYFG